MSHQVYELNLVKRDIVSNDRQQSVDIIFFAIKCARRYKGKVFLS